MDGDSNGETLVSYYRSILYEMVDDPSTDSIVSWSENGKSFVVGDEVEFRKALLPSWGLGHLGFSQSEKCEYSCPYFMRGQPDLKPSQDNLRKIETDNKVHFFFFFFDRCFFFLFIILIWSCVLLRAWIVAAFLATKKCVGLRRRIFPLP